MLILADRNRLGSIQPALPVIVRFPPMVATKETIAHAKVLVACICMCRVDINCIICMRMDECIYICTYVCHTENVVI